ncbi:MAG: phage holin family protein [Bacteroidia bacterium]|nr:phage holin family protein [Bacteroidia bacterium]
MSDQPSFFSEIKQMLVDYFEAKIQLYKIGAYEKIAKITAVLFSSIIIALLGFFLLLFLSISGGFYFGGLLNNNALGFLLIFGIYLILFVILILFRKKLLEKHIMNKVIEQLFEKEENDQ